MREITKGIEFQKSCCFFNWKYLPGLNFPRQKGLYTFAILMEYNL